MASLDEAATLFPCNHCGAEPGEPCWRTNRQTGRKTPMETCHVPRHIANSASAQSLRNLGATTESDSQAGVHSTLSWNSVVRESGVTPIPSTGRYIAVVSVEPDRDYHRQFPTEKLAQRWVDDKLFFRLVVRVQHFNTEGDTVAGAVAVEELRNWCRGRELPRNQLTAGGVAVIEHDRLTRRGPLVTNPNNHVTQIIAALDADDPDRARSLMDDLNGSWASRGPNPDLDHKMMLARAMLRSEWNGGTP